MTLEKTVCQSNRDTNSETRESDIGEQVHQEIQIGDEHRSDA